MTFENGHGHAHDEEQHHDAPGHGQRDAETPQHAEELVVEQDQRGFDGDGGAEVEHFDCEEDLSEGGFCQRTLQFMVSDFKNPFPAGAVKGEFGFG